MLHKLVSTIEGFYHVHSTDVVYTAENESTATLQVDSELRIHTQYSIHLVVQHLYLAMVANFPLVTVHSHCMFL